jgi:anaerobic selenocysteine-containing dehydrogenase
MAIRQIHTYCAMCVSHCGVVATVSEGVLTKVTPDPAHPNGGICVKGTAAPELVYAPDRLRHPMVRTHPKDNPDPGWARISWDEALARTASRLLEIKARHGPEAVAVPIATPAGSPARAVRDLSGHRRRRRDTQLPARPGAAPRARGPLRPRAV